MTLYIKVIYCRVNIKVTVKSNFYDRTLRIIWSICTQNGYKIIF